MATMRFTIIKDEIMNKKQNEEISAARVDASDISEATRVNEMLVLNKYTIE